MIAALMCGGKGSRLVTPLAIEKPLLGLKGGTMIDLVIEALLRSEQFDKILALPSFNTPKTTEYLSTHRYTSLQAIDVIETEGVSYSSDLSAVVSKLKPARVFVVSADLPLLNPKIVKKIVARCLPCTPCVSIMLEKLFVKSIGITPSIVTFIGMKEYCHSGITVLDSSRVSTEHCLEEHYELMNNVELAVNVNTIQEFKIAKDLLNRND